VNTCNISLAFLLILIISAPCSAENASCAKEPAKIFALRHTETDDSRLDRPLSHRGEERARALVDVIGPAKVSAIYVTELRRTKETAKPLSESQKIATKGIKKEYTNALCQRLCSIHSRETVVVVGHSDTIPDVLQCIGSPSASSVAYGDLFVVTFPDGKASVEKGRFGDPH
jgi:broad specificity phosphatase PhoE